ncbi:tetratricopeptide repeat protein [Ursidibacter arcticus]
MKQKISSLLNKIKSVKKRVWAILIAVFVLIFSIRVYWNSLSYEGQLGIRAVLGSDDAKWTIGERRIKDACNKVDEFDEWLVGNGVAYFLKMDPLEAQKALLVFYGSDRWISMCSRIGKEHSVRYIIWSKLQDSIYNDEFDWEKLEQHIVNRDGYYMANLVHFYYANNIPRIENALGKIIPACTNNVVSELTKRHIRAEWKNRDCLWRGILTLKASGILGDRNFYSSPEIIKIFERFAEISTTEEERQEAKYLFAKFFLGRNKNDSKALSMMNELANQNYGSALLFLGNMNRYSSPKLAESYFLKATESNFKHLTERSKAYLALYELYSSRSDLLKVDNHDKISLLEKAWVKDNMSYNYIEYADRAFDLAQLYFEQKYYGKAQDIYEAVLRYENHQEAFIKLGDIFSQGLGQRQDLKKAADYYGKACDLKNQEACNKFREVNEKMH